LCHFGFVAASTGRDVSRSIWFLGIRPNTLLPGTAHFIIISLNPVPLNLESKSILCQATEASLANMASSLTLSIDEGPSFGVVQGQNCILRAQFVDKVIVNATWANALESQNHIGLAGKKVCNILVSKSIIKSLCDS
jgi:hypothetical protein